MRRWRSLRAFGLALAAAGVLAAAPAQAGDHMASEGGFGALSALATLVYGPVKILYAAGGLVFGGAAYGLSGGDSAVLDAVVTPAVRGDYVVTPSVLRGERPLEFFGRDPRYRDDDTVLAEDF